MNLHLLLYLKQFVFSIRFSFLAVGVMKVHNYEFGKFVGTTVVTVIAMIIIVFLIFMVCLLAQQVYGWIATVFTEIIYR